MEQNCRLSFHKVANASDNMGNIDIKVTGQYKKPQFRAVATMLNSRISKSSSDADKYWDFENISFPATFDISFQGADSAWHGKDHFPVHGRITIREAGTYKITVEAKAP